MGPGPPVHGGPGRRVIGRSNLGRPFRDGWLRCERRGGRLSTATVRRGVRWRYCWRSLERRFGGPFVTVKGWGGRGACRGHIKDDARVGEGSAVAEACQKAALGVWRPPVKPGTGSERREED